MTGTPVRGAGRLVCARSVSRAASPTTGPHRRRAQGGTWLAPPALTAGSASEGLGQPRARHARRWSCSPQCQAEPGLPSIKPPPLRPLQEHRVAASALFPQPGATARICGLPGPWAGCWGDGSLGWPRQASGQGQALSLQPLCLHLASPRPPGPREAWGLHSPQCQPDRPQLLWAQAQLDSQK